MKLIYITGVEGSGKSAVCDYLVKNGYKALDIDKEGLSKRYYKGTWNVTKSLPNPEDSSFEWYNNREWKVSPKDLQKLRNYSDTKTLSSVV